MANAQGPDASHMANLLWRMPSPRRGLSTAAAKLLWTERPDWRPANRGDSQFVSERRLWQMQMTELRRNLLHEDLLKRRAAHVAKRQAAEEIREAQMRDEDPMAEVRRREVQGRVAAERDAAVRQREAARAHGQERLAARREVEQQDRLSWLHALQKEYDVTGNEAPKFSLSARKRSFLTPENIDKKLSMLLMGVKSPVEDWTNRARDTQATEEQQQKYNLLGGGPQGGRLSDALRESSGGARPFRAEVSEAERQADLDAGRVAPIDTNDAEFIDRLRNIMGNLTPEPGKTDSPPPSGQPGGEGKKE